MDEKTISYRDLLTMLAGLGVITPQEGFKSEGDIRWHIEVGLKDANRKGIDESLKRERCNVPWEGPGSVDE